MAITPSTNITNRFDLTLDFDSDVADLPAYTATCAPGSTAFVIESGTLYMLNSLGEWREI